MIFREPPPKELAEHRRWMTLALEEARLAGLRGEVPVGAVIVREIGRASCRERV